MAGPTTEYLAEQMDRIRDEVQAIRREGLDGRRELNDILNAQLRELREDLGEQIVQLRREVGAGVEAIKVDQIQFRENIARLQAQTDATIARVDRNQDFLDKLLFWAVGLAITVGGGIFWKAAQAVNLLDDHGRRIEVVEKEAKENQIKNRESFDELKGSQARLGTSLDKLEANQARLRESMDRSDANQVKLGASIDQFRKTLDERLPTPAPR